ncbi:hypothetical protein [Kineococcus sp. NUM-3379]
MSVSPCRDVSAAGWIESSRQPWHRLVSLGPAGFAAYARLRFVPDPTWPGQFEGDVALGPGPDAPSENDQVRAALTVLAAHTATADRCFFAVWDGWGLVPTDEATPRMRVPNRDHLLFEGSASDLGDSRQWDRVLRPRDGRGTWADGPCPAFVWPADRAWCLTRDVDTHYAAIGASGAAVQDLLDLPHLDVVPADLGEEPPHHL